MSLGPVRPLGPVPSTVWVCSRQVLNADGLGAASLSVLLTLTLVQLEKVYDPKNEDDDMREMEEERLRMREHVMKTVSLGALGRGTLQCPHLRSHLALPLRWTPTRTAW